MKQKLVILGSVAFVALMFTAAAGQAQTPAPSPGGVPTVQHRSLLTTIYEGGWVMFPIALCSIFTVYLIGDGVTRTAPNNLAPADDTKAVQNLFRQGDYVGAYNYCKSHPAPVTNVVRVGVSYLGDGKNMTENAMSEELAKENSQLQTKLSYLSVIGVCTPMIGLLGTVTGMMGAFSTLGTAGIGDPGKLAGSIGEVLVATASGLFIAIPAFGAFYYLRNRAAAGLHVIEDTVNSLFRKMPYEMLNNVHIGDEELFAAAPNWVHGEQAHDAHGHSASDVHLDVEPQTVTAQAPTFLASQTSSLTP